MIIIWSQAGSDLVEAPSTEKSRNKKTKIKTKKAIPCRPDRVKWAECSKLKYQNNNFEYLCHVGDALERGDLDESSDSLPPELSRRHLHIAFIYLSLGLCKVVIFVKLLLLSGQIHATFWVCVSSALSVRGWRTLNSISWVASIEWQQRVTSSVWELQELETWI